MRERLGAALLALTPMLGAQENELTRALDEKRYADAGKLATVALLTVDAARRLSDLTREGLAAVHGAFQTMSERSEKPGSLLLGLIAHRAGECERAVQHLDRLLDERFAAGIVHVVGRDAMQLCRRGEAAGARVLARIHERWPRASWSRSNLALGLRLLGRYREAEAHYVGLMKKIGRASWVLNDLGLLYDAMGDRRRALAVLQEGSRAIGQERSARDTCAGNAAILLLQRDGPGDRVTARRLLAGIVARDASRNRARYWLAQLDRRGSGLSVKNSAARTSRVPKGR